MIILTDNNIQVIEDSFVDLDNLTHLWLNKNGLRKFHVLSNNTTMSQLIFLDLSENNLRHVGSFPSLLRLPSLQVLAIHNNKYVHYPETFISFMKSLQNLTLDLFRDFKFGPGFLPLEKLQRLDFYLRNGNNFHLGNDSFLGLRNTNITSLEMDFRGYVTDIDIDVFSPFQNLKELNLNVRPQCDIRRALKALYGLQGKEMEYLNMSGNFFSFAEVTTLTEKDIQYLSTMCVKRVDLSNCDIAKIPDTISKSRFAKCVEYLSLGKNIFLQSNIFPVFEMLSYGNITYFDMSLDPFPVPKHSDIISDSRYISNSLMTFYEVFMPFGNKAFEFTVTLSESLRVFNVSGCLTIGTISEHSYLSARIVGKGLEVADLSFVPVPFCRNNSHFTFHTRIKNLNLTKWRCAHLNATFLSSIPTLETLTFQDADLSDGFKNDPKGIFLKGLYNLTTLDLGKNKLTNLHENLLNDQASSLRNIYIQDNAFRHIPQTLRKLRGLKLLDIQNNKLSSLSEYDIDALEDCREATIRISRNPFDCTCESLQMIKWLERNEYRIEDFDDIFCIQGAKLKTITINIRQFKLKCLSKFWLEFSASMCILLVLAIIGTAICYRYRVFLEYMYIILLSHRQNKYCANDSYEFDAFISYSNKDYEWVINTLYKRMTEEMNMKVSIHDKDFIPGRDIAHEILRCIDNSRKVIFVLTRNYLKSDWTNYELEMARIHAFRSGRSGLIIILKDGLQVKEMPDLLKRMWWKVVCAKWLVSRKLDNSDDNDSEDRKLFWQTLLKGIEDG